jgi:hypothetical protein
MLHTKQNLLHVSEMYKVLLLRLKDWARGLFSSERPLLLDHERLSGLVRVESECSSYRVVMYTKI